MKNELPNVSFDLGILKKGGSEGPTAYKREKIKGLSHFRILPPYGKLSHGSLFHKYSIHWGFTSERGNKKPVSCSYPTEGTCPVCTRVKDAKDQLTRLNGSSLTPDLKKKEEELKAFEMDFSVRRFFAYNAVNQSGEVCILELPGTAHERLKELMTEVVFQRKIDPVALRDGVWFTFNKSGVGLLTRYTVDIKKVIVNVGGEELEKIDRTPLSQELVEQLEPQLRGEAEDGPLYNIHELHEPSTAMELASYLGTGVVVSKRQAPRVQAQAQEEDIPEHLGTGFSADQYRAMKARGHTSATPSSVVPVAPVQTAPVQAAQKAPSVSDLRAEIERLQAAQKAAQKNQAQTQQGGA